MKVIVCISIFLISCGTPGGGRYDAGNDDNAARGDVEAQQRESDAYEAHRDSLQIINDSLVRVVRLQQRRILELEHKLQEHDIPVY